MAHDASTAVSLPSPKAARVAYADEAERAYNEAVRLERERANMRAFGTFGFEAYAAATSLDDALAGLIHDCRRLAKALRGGGRRWDALRRDCFVNIGVPCIRPGAR